MKKILMLGALLLFVFGMFVKAYAVDRIAVDLISLLSTLNYNYENGQFKGDFGFSIYGIREGKVTVTIENGEGKKVFDRQFQCSEMYTYDESPACYLDSSILPAVQPYTAVDGPHTLKILIDEKSVYSLNYYITTKLEYDYKSVYITGDWDKLGLLDFSAAPGLGVSLYSGAPDQCGGKSQIIEVQLFRDGEYVARGQLDGYYYESCSTSQITFMLYTEDDKHFVDWLDPNKLAAVDGTYQLKFFKDKYPAKTFEFKIAGGKVESAPSAGLQSALQPGAVRSTEMSRLMYAK